MIIPDSLSSIGYEPLRHSSIKKYNHSYLLELEVNIREVIRGLKRNQIAEAKYYNKDLAMVVTEIKHRNTNPVS